MDGQVMDVTERLSERRIRNTFWNAFGTTFRDALEDDNTIEIMINEDGALWVETYSGMYCAGDSIGHEERTTIVRLLADARGSAATWELQAELIETGDRFQAILPPIVPSPSMAIRKHRTRVIPIETWVNEGRLDRSMPVVADDRAGDRRALGDVDLASKMRRFLEGKRGIAFAGATGSGKTTLLNSTALLIPETERVITIEDTREIAIPHIKNRTQWLAFDGVVSMHNLARRTLRMRPDRTIIGEASDGKTLMEALKISLTGHKGTMMTIHATSAAEALARMDHLLSEVSVNPQRQLVASVFGLIVFMENKRVTEVLELKACVNGEYSYSVL